MSTLYLVATPIGNMEDLSYRAARVLSEVDGMAAEDTRVTRKIFDRFGLKAPPIRFSCHEHNEEHAARRILALLGAGKNIALCTDGGMPGISDPGYRVVNACREQGHRVEVIPGPCAAIAALVASGLPAASFTFKGFPPRKSNSRKRFLEQDKELPHTLIFFESPHRLLGLLKDALETLGNRQAAVCMEMTKQYEAIHRASLADLISYFDDQETIRGEITVVIAGNHPKFFEQAHEEKPLPGTPEFLFGKR